MSNRKTLEEQLEDTVKKQEQLKAREKELRHKYNEVERKKRNKRLVEMGIIVETFLGRPSVDEDKERLKNFLKLQEQNGTFFSRFMNKDEVQKGDSE